MKIAYSSLKHSHSISSEYVVVTWCFFNICNYNCSYCSPAYKEGSKRGFDLPTLISFSQRVVDHYQDKKIFFELTGGEITYYPEILPFLSFLKSKGIETAIVSNGSRTISWWKEIIPFLDHIALSFHPESANEEHFVELIQELLPTTGIHLNVMMVKDKFDYCYEFALRIHQLYPNISLTMQPIMGRDPNYSSAQKYVLHNQLFSEEERLQKFSQQSDVLFSKPNKAYRSKMVKVFSEGNEVVVHPHELIRTKENNWKGWKCSAGLENLLIDWDGEIHRAWCKIGGPIGHVQDLEICFPRSEVVCDREACHFSYDVLIKKEST